ncbi:protein OSCP1 [Papilio machaon]|uniref:protein OSCP1 n=1 Tax=Papilio machaon TaxID=76193 RepID=UPI001E6661F4|nr:protein OSCP1 [Papilio machaon]
MSHFATPFIVINLGCEMIYVIDQRLKSQNIPMDKSERVLTDIVTVLLHPKLQQELFLPQPVAAHSVIKQLLQDISAASIMKLDEYSMNKLWDLMTMILKWQISITNNHSIFDITRRHLKGVATLMPDNFSKSIFDDVLKQIQVLQEKMSDDAYKCLYNTILLWFSEYHTKISVLLRLGLQNKDGTFNSSTIINPKIAQNLGENIYKYDNKKDSLEEYDKHTSDNNEINCLLAHIETTKNSEKQSIQIKLPLEMEANSRRILNINKDYFEKIQTNVIERGNDLSFVADVPKSPQEDLLKMLNDI